MGEGGGTIRNSAELEDRPEWCLGLTLMYALLCLGYEFPAERSIRIEKQIEGSELGVVLECDDCAYNILEELHH